MKKLKITSPFNLAVCLILIITVIYTFIYINNPPPSKYFGGENQIIGYIYNIQKKEDKIVLKVKAKENILINYYGQNSFKLGQKIKAIGKMKEPSNSTNFYLFDYKQTIHIKRLESKKILLFLLLQLKSNFYPY